MRRSAHVTDARYRAFLSERNRRPIVATPQELEVLKSRVLAFTGGKIMFDAPVVVKNAQVELFTCYGVWADKHRGLWLMDGQGEWHEIRHDQANAGYVIAGINQRVKQLRYERSKVLPEC